MYAEHFIDERVMSEKQHVSGRNQRTSPRRLPGCYRICLLLDLAQGLEKASQSYTLHPSKRVLLPDPVYLLGLVWVLEPPPMREQVQTLQRQYASTR